MESVEKDCSILGSLFQTIVHDLRNSTPIWEDFSYKATKLHQCLKTTLVAISSFLEAFQRVADMATNSKGATKEIGSALTRLCMRHRSIENCLKQLTSSILDSMVAPLQERSEDWKKAVAQLDKDHAKEYKKARQEIKKAASDTMRLQKKVRKGIPHGKNEMKSKLDVAMQDVNARYHQLEEAEKNCVRTALIEERSRFCLFITCIKPFVDHEIHLLTEVTHLQDIMHSLCLQASDPQSLPASSEQVITDIKGMDPATLNLQPHVKQHHSPPSSPSSLGSRKSSMCSINSINSSSSGSSKSHSPSHTMHKRTASQPPMVTERLTSVSSQDSGFTSQDTLFLRPTTPQSLSLGQISDVDGTDYFNSDSTPTTPSANATTPTPSSSGSGSSTSLPSVASPLSKKIERARPHTISAGTEKSYSRPALKPELFEPLPEKGEEGVEMREGPRIAGGKARSKSSSMGGYHHQQLGSRLSATINKMQPVLPPHCPRPKVKAVPPPSLPPGAQPVYANTMDLQRMAQENQARHQQEARETTAGTSRQSAQLTPEQQQEAEPEPGEASAVNALNLEEAIRSLDTITTALVTDVTQEEAAATVAADREAEEKKELEEIELRRSSRSQKQMQQNSLELAAAIRELEESTAALNSTYDDSATASHTSLHCSSGYATMNSTPSGSEDTIASGGVPASGANTMRKASSSSSPRPPPPVRRTAFISATPSGGPGPGGGGGPLAQRQVSDSAVPAYPGVAGVGGGGGGTASLTEGPYAELQLIQQAIQKKKPATQQQQQQQQQHQQQPAPPPKPGQLQRQLSGGGGGGSSDSSPQHYAHQSPHMSSPSPDRMSVSSGSSSGSGGHYAVPNLVSPSSASVIQSLNAKFASLNQQYQEPQPQPQPGNEGGGGGGTYVGGSGRGGGGEGDPTAATLMPPPPPPAPVSAAPLAAAAAAPPVIAKTQGVPGTKSTRLPPTHHPPPPGSLQHRQSLHGQGPGHAHGQGQGHAPASPRPMPESGNIHAQMQQLGEGEDFPLPPTAEELAAMETLYTQPSLPQHHPLHHAQPHPQPQPQPQPPPATHPKPKVDLMTELKRRMSAEEASDV